MLLEAVERHVWIELRVVIVEADDEPEREMSIRHRVDERPAELILRERIAERVHHGPGGDAIRRDVPQLFEADRELLRTPTLTKLQPAHQLLGQIAADAVAEDRDLRVDVHTG